MTGLKPFYIDDDSNLFLKFSPIIPGWLFTEDGIVSFTFLGSINVTYHNPYKQDTWNLMATQV